MQVQWRFVNRAIDEVENNSVPAVVLLCRNSTDTAYYQRLRPYPRILMRRSATQVKCTVGLSTMSQHEDPNLHPVGKVSHNNTPLLHSLHASSHSGRLGG